MLLNAHRLWWGAWDWRHAGWHSRYYPDDLPEDWRLAYYANEFRCVGVPLNAWYEDPAGAAAALRDAAPPGFVFVVQAPPGLAQEGPAREAVRALAGRLDGYLGALLLPAAGEDPQALAAGLAWAGELAPALADGAAPGADEGAAQRVWRPALGGAPAPAGPVVVARVPVAQLPDLPALRAVVEGVLAAAGERPALVLLEEDPADQAEGAPAAPQRLRELGILAGLLGVA